MRITEKYIYVPEADDMPIERWTAYMICKAIESGLKHNNWSIGVSGGKSRITVYEKPK